MGADFPWIVDAAAARSLIGEGAAVVDARKDDVRAHDPLPGAVVLPWTRLTFADIPDKGRLLEDDEALAALLGATGLSTAQPVLVVTNSLAGGGEDGRQVWALRTLGHSRVALVDGGVAALRAAGPLTITPPAGGGFAVHRQPRWEISREELRQAVAEGAVAVLDTRETREYQGETPHGEARGGIVPGARHLWYRNLVGPDGRILPREQVAARLNGLGIGPDSDIVAYCTGGVRAGFVTTVLSHYGYRVRNYAGSMWHWAAGPADAYPLVAAPA